SVVTTRERGELDLIAHDTGHYPRVSPQQADGAAQDRVEHGLDILLRAADDAQDVTHGGLRVEGPREVTVARLKLSEQPPVLDGDHGLIGEGLEQGDLALAEGLHL